MQRALITGGAGFIGSHLAEALLVQGHSVVVVDDQSTGSKKNIEHLLDRPHFKFVDGSVSDTSLVTRLVAEADEVYHMAAAVGVALINQEPIQTIERNIYPTELILKEVAYHNTNGRRVKLFLASTSEVYGKNPKEKWTEEDDLVFGATTRPRWSYGASKAIDEFLALAYWNQKKTPVVIGRFFNVVGPRQTGAYGMVLPRFVDAALSGRSPIVHHDGSQIRCFAHVADIIGAVTTLMQTDSALGQVFNIGSDRPVSILQLAEMVLEQTNPKLSVQFQSYEDAYSSNFEDIARRVPDLTKLKQHIQYSPKFSLEEIVSDVIRWKKEG